MQDPGRRAGPLQLGVQGRDVGSLLGQPGLVHTARDGEALRVVGDRDVLVPEGAARLRHLAERGGTIAVGRVHLEVGAERLLPVAVVGQHGANL
jgi:hypothetical protein